MTRPLPWLPCMRNKRCVLHSIAAADRTPACIAVRKPTIASMGQCKSLFAHGYMFGFQLQASRYSIMPELLLFLWCRCD